MRRTKKYKAAIAYMRKNEFKSIPRENAKVYEALEKRNVFWFPDEGIWQERQHKPSTSVFANDDGSPTGIIHIRVMGHPDDVGVAVGALILNNDPKVIDVSEKTYPNRKGKGVRQYIVAKLGDYS